jgi:D-beta-D-heptose 7-phosphate kinase/D-beta-D-heptose 1-phosphate adenosyltransferase
MIDGNFDFDLLARGSVLIIGDVMLDLFVYGTVSRISPEAPIPVISVTKETFMVGGAANVALNVDGLGARSVLIGVIGDDAHGAKLKELLVKDNPRRQTELIVDKRRPTTLKVRYVGNRQQMLRADHESSEQVCDAVEKAILAKVGDQIDSSDIVVISDYAKGVITDRVLAGVFALCGNRGVPVVVDPKRTKWNAYRGATYIKPNIKELARATGLDCEDAEEANLAAAQVVSSLGTKVLLTRSQDGMSLFRPDRPPVHAHATAYEVYDVSGAGDTAIAVFAAALAGSVCEEDAMYLANVASGIAVTKLGTAIVSAQDLRDAWWHRRSKDQAEGIVSQRNLPGIVNQWRLRGHTVGFTNGCFDIVHSGHVALLSAAAAKCDHLIVAINSDESVRRLKGPTRPVQNQDVRAQVIGSISGIDLVTIFDEDTPLELIKLVKPDMIFKGADYGESQVVGGELVKSWGGKVILVDLVREVSTTNVIERIRR